MTQADATVMIGTLIVLAIVGLGLLTIGLVFSKPWASIAAALAFVGFAALGFLERATWDVATLFIWLGIGLALVCTLASIGVHRSTRPPSEPKLPPDDAYEKELDQQSEEYRERRRKRVGEQW